MEEKKKKRNLILGIIGIIVLVAGVIGLTYAYFNSKSQSDTITVTSGNLKINFTDGALINASDIEPINESEILTKATKKSFGIAKTSDSNNMYARIDITDIVVSENFQNYDLKWALYQDDVKVTTGTFVVTSDGNNSINMATNVLIDSTTFKNYNLYIWIQETNKDQSAMMDGSLSGKITVTAQKDKLNTLASNILGNNNSNVLTGEYNFGTDFTCTGFGDIEGIVDATCTSNYTTGLYSQQGNSTKSNYGFPTYYYKGAVENNYVSFGKYKNNITNHIINVETGDYVSTVVAHTGDSMIWRIVRINEDGSIKLILENGIGEQQLWNSTGSDRYVNTNGSKSEIKTVVDNFYTTTINESNLNSKVQIGNFCNDTSLNSEGFSNPWDRIVLDMNPIFTCPKEGVMINEKAGLITADEMMYAGALYTNTESSTMIKPYLNNKTDFWSMTPSGAGIYSGWSGNDALLGDDTLEEPVEFILSRPVINLKPDVIVSAGNGTSSSPYVIQ